MKYRNVALRTGALTACLLTLAAACTSNHKTSTAPSSSRTTSTTSYLEAPNEIPFEVGEKIGLANGWTVRIGRVLHNYTAPHLPSPAAEHEYVALDFDMDNEGSTTETVKASDLFVMGD